jgi:hypothetical protein
MAEQILDHVNVDALFQEMGGEAVPQRVHGDRFIKPRGLNGAMADALQLARRNPPSGVSWEQPVLRTLTLPLVAKDAEQLLGQHDIAIFAPLGLPNDYDHPRAIDIAGGQLHDLGDT